MGKATWQPKWWKPETHGSGWERVKEALKRDWEQTKSDLHMKGGRDRDQDVGDTVKQMAGKEPIPNSRNLGTDSWDDVEPAMMFGYGARDQYGTQHNAWNDNLESTLRRDWDEGRGTTGKTWDQVKAHVRRGFERARS